MIPQKELLKNYEEYKVLIRNTESIIDSCNFSFDFKTIKNKKTYTDSVYDDKLLLEKIAFDGMKNRYGKDNKIAHERVRKELDIRDKLGFSAYFLITADIIRYSMHRGYYHVGRGRGNNH